MKRKNKNISIFESAQFYLSFLRFFLWFGFFLSVFFYFQNSLQASKLKDISTVKGVRENILIGYGLVVGLRGTGDSSSQVTAKSLGRLFQKLGLNLAAGATVRSKNVAAVIVTAKLPPFAKVGQKIDVTVSSIGDAKSLQGGVLLVTPLRAGDQNVYAVAQGSVSMGALASGGGKQIFPTVGRVVSGATIEKDLDLNFAQKKSFRLTLNQADFTSSARVENLINEALGGKFAHARDSATIDVIVPFHYEGDSVQLLARLENIEVNLAQKAKVVLNERTATVVLGGDVTIAPVAISHGDLVIKVKPTTQGARALAQVGGGKKNTQISKHSVLYQSKRSTVADLVRILNKLGVKPKDMSAIFQALKQSGALHAELDIL